MSKTVSCEKGPPMRAQVTMRLTLVTACLVVVEDGYPLFVSLFRASRDVDELLTRVFTKIILRSFIPTPAACENVGEFNVRSQSELTRKFNLKNFIYCVELIKLWNLATTMFCFISMNKLIRTDVGKWLPVTEIFAF